MTTNGNGWKGPLAGVRVADFSWFGAGPIAGGFLAHYGAEVIRVESTTHPDGLRMTQPVPPGKEGLNVSGYYNNFNANKLSMTIDMTHPKAKDVALKLIARCDVVMENYTPRVFEKWGLTYEAMKEVKPDIIFTRLAMQGFTGPHKDFLGFGAVLTPLAGITHLSGYPDRPPIGLGTNYPDYVINPSHVAIAILAALRHRRRTGEGQLVELAQLESTAASLGVALMDYAANGTVQNRRGNKDDYAAPHGAYPCAGEDRWCVIAVTSEEEWKALCEVANPEWAGDPRFATFEQRKANEEDLDTLVAEWTKDQEAPGVMKRLQAAGVPAGVVHTAEDVLDHDLHMKERGYYIYLDHPEAGHNAYDGQAARLANSPGRLVRPAPMIGEHTFQLATELLGLEAEAVAELTGEGVLA
jgi:benzylsuccinate CoA-transferase BbsF subunit